MPARRAAAPTRSLTAFQPHRRAHRAAKQVHEHEITRSRSRDGHPLELVGVERLHRQEIQRHRPRAGTWRSPRSRCPPAAPRAGAGGRSRTRARGNQPADGHHCGAAPAPRRGAAQARTISSTISRSRAEPHAPSTATTSPSSARSTRDTGSCSRCRARIRQPAPPSSPRAAHRKIPVISNLMQNLHQVPWSRALRNRVHGHAPDRGQHRVDPPGRAHRRRPRPGQHRSARQARPHPTPHGPRAPARS